MLWHWTSTSVNPLKPWQICLHFSSTDAKTNWILQKSTVDKTHCMSLSDVTVHLSSRGEHPNESNLGSEMEELRVPLASPHFFLHSILHLYFRCFEEALIQWDLYEQAKKKIEFVLYWHYKNQYEMQSKTWCFRMCLCTLCPYSDDVW